MQTHVFLKRLFAFAVVILGFAVTADAKPKFQLNAKQAILIDLSTNTVLFEKNADDLVPPSSMSKIMTVYVAFDSVSKGQASFDDLVTVSKKAWKMGGSRMFLDVGSEVTIRDLIRGVIVQSGNDAAVALAEGLAGSEEDFVELMTQTARDIGVLKGAFANATGWPNRKHLLTVRELATIGIRTIRDFPDYYPYYRELEMTHNNIRQPNRNTLLYANVGCDGMKTGYTDLGGYGVIASAEQNGRRLLLVINGCASQKKRASDSKRLMTWGFKGFASPRYFSAGDVVETADVWLGQQRDVALYTKHDIATTVLKTQLKHIKAEVVYKTPLEAPFHADEHVADVILKNTKTGEEKSYPLYTQQAVKKVGVFGRMSAAFRYLVFGS